MLTTGNTTIALPPMILEAPRFCAMCNTTVAKRGSLCHACADEIDRQMIDDNPVDNFPTCPNCGGELVRGRYCWSDRCLNWKWGVE